MSLKAFHLFTIPHLTKLFQKINYHSLNYCILLEALHVKVLNKDLVSSLRMWWGWLSSTTTPKLSPVSVKLTESAPFLCRLAVAAILTWVNSKIWSVVDGQLMIAVFKLHNPVHDTFGQWLTNKNTCTHSHRHAVTWLSTSEDDEQYTIWMKPTFQSKPHLSRFSEPLWNAESATCFHDVIASKTQEKAPVTSCQISVQASFSGKQPNVDVTAHYVHFYILSMC